MKSQNARHNTFFTSANLMSPLKIHSHCFDGLHAMQSRTRALPHTDIYQQERQEAYQSESASIVDHSRWHPAATNLPFPGITMIRRGTRTSAEIDRLLRRHNATVSNSSLVSLNKSMPHKKVCTPLTHARLHRHEILQIIDSALDVIEGHCLEELSDG